jgi:Uma2 family endonuclease
MPVTEPTTHRRRMTLEEYLSGPADERKAELIYGDYVVCASPSDLHQDVQINVAWLLRVWARAHDLGRVSHDLDMVLDDLKNLAYRPDVLFVARAHEARWQRKRVFGPADLCVEILSPSDKPHVQRRKFADYERYGVAWYWILDPDKGTLEENELAGESFRCRTEVEGEAWFEPGLFPGLRFRLPQLIAGDLKAAVQGAAEALF